MRCLIFCVLFCGLLLVEAEDSCANVKVPFGNKEPVPCVADFFKYKVYLNYLKEGFDGNKKVFDSCLFSSRPEGVNELCKDLFSIADYWKASNVGDFKKKLKDFAGVAEDCFFIGLEIKKRNEGLIEHGSASVLGRYQRCLARMMASLEACKMNGILLKRDDFLDHCVFAPQKAKELVELIDKARSGQTKKGQFIGEKVCKKICAIVEKFIP